MGLLAERIDNLTWRVLIFACGGLGLIVGLGELFGVCVLGLLVC